MLRSIGKQPGERIYINIRIALWEIRGVSSGEEEVGYGGENLQKRKVFKPGMKE